MLNSKSYKYKKNYYSSDLVNFFKEFQKYYSCTHNVRYTFISL